MGIDLDYNINNMETSVNNKCKAFTSLEQSKKLAEILPLESADMKEEWRDIEGYEGLYMVSNFGRVVSFQGCNPRIMKLGMTHKDYQCVGLQKNKQHKTCVVHRLVARAFIPNPYNLPQVNHKDENKTNNCVDNLEWCTPKYNNSYGTKTKRQLETYKKHKTSNAEKEVVMLSLEGDIVNVYKSLSDASRQTGLSLGSLSEVCNKIPHRLTLGGYKWKFKE